MQDASAAAAAAASYYLPSLNRKSIDIFYRCLKGLNIDNNVEQSVKVNPKGHFLSLTTIANQARGPDMPNAQNKM